MSSAGNLRSVAVTGAAGYVGRRLVALLAADPTLQVTALVRRPVALPAGVRTVCGDLGADGTADRLCDGATAVVHLAGPNEVAAAADPEGTIRDVVAAALRLADAAVRQNVERVVYLSTVHVYGARLTPGATVSEETPAEARSPYAIARLAAEQILAARGPGDPVVFRVTNSVGAPAAPEVDRWSLVVNDLCRQGAVDGVLRLRTSGTQWRDFVPLADVCRIVAAATDPGAVRGGAYNLGSGQPLTVRALAGLVIDAFAELGVPGLRLHAPEPEANAPAAYRVSVDKLAVEGLRADGPVAAAVAETARWCLEHRDALRGVS